MKKLLGSFLAVVLLAGVSYGASAHFTETLPPASPAGAVPVANGYDWSLTTNPVNSVPGLAIPSWTVAITTTSLMASTTGQLIFCSNCAANGGNGTLCVSTGTTATYQFILSTGTPCK